MGWNLQGSIKGPPGSSSGGPSVGQFYEEYPLSIPAGSGWRFAPTMASQAILKGSRAVGIFAGSSWSAVPYSGLYSFGASVWSENGVAGGGRAIAAFGIGQIAGAAGSQFIRAEWDSTTAAAVATNFPTLNPVGQKYLNAGDFLHFAFYTSGSEASMPYIGQFWVCFEQSFDA